MACGNRRLFAGVLNAGIECCYCCWVVFSIYNEQHIQHLEYLCNALLNATAAGMAWSDQRPVCRTEKQKRRFTGFLNKIALRDSKFRHLSILTDDELKKMAMAFLQASTHSLLCADIMDSKMKNKASVITLG